MLTSQIIYLYYYYAPKVQKFKSSIGFEFICLLCIVSSIIFLTFPSVVFVVLFLLLYLFFLSCVLSLFFIQATGLTNHNADMPSERPHCNTNINFMKKWHLVGKGFRLPGQTSASSNKPLYVTLCFSGFMCEAIQVPFEYQVYKGCDRGYYEDTSITWQKSTTGGAANPEYCLQCPPGQYQDQRNQLKGSSTVCKKCPAGKFGDESNVPSRDSTSYCAACPAGRYGNGLGITDPLCNGACSAGFYCPTSVLNTRNTGGSSGAAKKISAQYFGGTGSATQYGSSECPAGYFCPLGTADTICGTSGAPSNCRSRCGYNSAVPEAYYCPAKSSAPIAVRAGYYSAGIGDPHKPTESRDQEKECKPPFYCPGGGTVGDGKEHKCPAGKFGSSNKLENSACDGDCQRGFFCTEGSDQNDENRCGREKEYASAFFCPPGSSAPSPVSPNKFTFCCADMNSDCPDNRRLACPEDQRHYQGDCPSGFTCQNGKPVTIKWRDENNIGMCYADNIDLPNIGQGTADVAEGTIGALTHFPGATFTHPAYPPDSSASGIRALDG